MAVNCFHCGDTIPNNINLSITIADKKQPVCCIGCQTVAETILAGGFDQYYQFRSQNPDKPVATQHTEAYLPFDEPSVQAEFVTPLSESLLEADLAIEGMHCAACAWLIEQRLVRLTGVKQIRVNAASNRAKVIWYKDQCSLSDIFSAIADIGYQSFPFKINEQEARFKATNKAFLRRIAVAALMSMQIMMLAFAMYTGVLEKEYDTFFRWISLLLTTPIIAYSAYPIIYSAIRAILNKTVNMDVPVTIAIVGIFFASVLATVTVSGEVYYESISMFTLLLLLGRYLEHNVKAKAASITANMLKLIPLIASKKTTEGIVEVSAKSLIVNDMIIVKEGSAISADGLLMSTNAFIDESMLTGESEPVHKQQGQIVLAGSISANTIEVKVTAVGNATTLSQMANGESIQTSNSTFVSISDTVSKYFVYGVLVIAIITYSSWTFLAGENGFWPMIAVLVATCPCALSLAMPTAMTAITAGLKKHSILINNTAALEAIPSIQMMGFDKTGTLTLGVLSIKKQLNFKYDKEDCLQIAQALEAYSSHPIASAFKQLKSSPTLIASDVTATAGQGIAGYINNKHYKLGNALFTHITPDEKTANARLLLTENGQLIAAFWLSDPIRKDAKSSIDALPCKAVMLSGDNVHTVTEVANNLNMDFKAALSPEEKVIALDKYRQQFQGQPVAMVGDGINDALVLENADVSIAVANATDLSKQKADIILLGGQLTKINHLFTAGKQLNSIIKQNIAWAIGYNLLVLPLAMLGILTPYAAVAGMSLSSLLVVINSTRLLKI